MKKEKLKKQKLSVVAGDSTVYAESVMSKSSNRFMCARTLLKRNTPKGITLVALVITIIVLLILAMVSISIVMNQGIITKSKDAVDKYNQKAEEEQVDLREIEKNIEKYSNINSGWWNLTEQEKIEIGWENNSGVVASLGGGSNPGEKTVVVENEVITIILMSEDKIEGYFYYFGNNDKFEIQAIGIEINKGKWYYLEAAVLENGDVGEINKHEEYQGESPIKQEDFTEVNSETYLEKIIDSFNK